METNPGPTCDNNPQIWLGISDIQGEQKHLNTAMFSYRDIFLDTEIVVRENFSHGSGYFITTRFTGCNVLQ